MLKNNKINMILALIVAIALWAYVLGEINPESTVVVRSVPITLENQDALEETGLTVLSMDHEDVNITISGQRTAVTKVNADSFSVTADIDALSMGENTVRLNVSGPDSVNIESINVEKITVVIDELETQEKTVAVVIDGESSSDQEPYIVETSAETVNVTGAKTLVDRVSVVNATVDRESITDTMKTLDATMTAVDSQGREIGNLRFGTNNVSVTAVMLNKKTVHLEVPVINEDEGDAQRSISFPRTIVVKGTEEALASVSTITCQTVDLSNIYENTTIALSPILPDGIQLGFESEGVSATVSVRDLSRQTFSFDQSDISLTNRTSGLTYTVSGISFTVDAAGRESVVSDLVSGDFQLAVDVRGLARGTHTVALSVTCSKEVSTVTASVETVEITIE